jgi:hypothetical protein
LPAGVARDISDRKHAEEKLVVEQLGNPRGHHLAVVGAVELGLLAPDQLVVALADQRVRVQLAGVAGKRGVAAEEARLAILPEDAHRCRIDDRAQQLVRGLQFLFGVLAIGNVAGDAEDRVLAGEAEQMHVDLDRDRPPVLR